MTLIIVALAAIVVIAFLTTSTTERTTAAAYGRVTKARQIAELVLTRRSRGLSLSCSIDLITRLVTAA
jgi:hypothetical protein